MEHNNELSVKRTRVVLIAFLLAFVALAVNLLYAYFTYGARWFSSPYNKRINTAGENVLMGNVSDRNGEILAYSELNDDGKIIRRYSLNDDIRLSTAHIMGDKYGMSIGAERFFARYLLGFEQRLDKRVVGEEQKRKGSNVTLTIDAKLSAYAFNLLGNNRGAAVIMNYKTGEILLSVSQPTYDIALIDEYLNNKKKTTDGMYVNRVTMSEYTPGSIFKTVTLIAALEYIPDVINRKFYCNDNLIFDYESGAYLDGVNESNVEVKYKTLSDYGNNSHGSLTLEQAYAKSCNKVFAKLAMEIGSKKLYRTAKSLGFETDFMFNDIIIYSSKYEVPTRDYDLAWSGVGQYKDIVTPMHMCMLISAIANNGVLVEPMLLKCVTDSNDGTVIYTPQPKVNNKYFDIKSEYAEYVKKCMFAAVDYGTAKGVSIDGYKICGKTGTAEVSQQENIKPHSWFTGYVDDENNPYAICVVIENAGSGSSVAVPIARKLLEMALGVATE